MSSKMAGFLGVLALAACSGAPSTPDAGSSSAGGEAPALRKVRLALNWYPEPEFGGFYAAQLSGLYREAGFDVEILPGGPACGSRTASCVGAAPSPASTPTATACSSTT